MRYSFLGTRHCMFTGQLLSRLETKCTLPHKNCLAVQLSQCRTLLITLRGFEVHNVHTGWLISGWTGWTRFVMFQLPLSSISSTASKVVTYHLAQLPKSKSTQTKSAGVGSPCTPQVLFGKCGPTCRPHILQRTLYVQRWGDGAASNNSFPKFREV